MWSSFAASIDNSFFFVVDKIIAMMDYFTRQARNIGSVVLLIAILTAALNYVLTGTGLKENAIKIMKASLFFLVTIAFYPNIVGWISSYAFRLAQGSVYPSVKEHFDGIVDAVLYNVPSDISHYDYYHTSQPPVEAVVSVVRKDNSPLFSNLTRTREAKTGDSNSSGKLTYTAFAPSAVAQISFFLASECFAYADNNTKNKGVFPDIGAEVSRVVKGGLCAFAIIFTGVFALIEYLVCFLEFMLVASVGVILFPMSIWEGSKFLSEKFIGALVGFFMKLLFCNISVFLLLYGFISMFSTFQKTNGFLGTVDQIIFIAFTCFLFFFICKSAPGVAQSLLTGTPTLNAAGAISAASGAVAAAGAVRGAVGKGLETVEKGATGLAMVGARVHAARKGVKDAGGGAGAMALAGFKSLGKDAGGAALGLTRSLLGMKGGVGGYTSEGDMNKKNTLRGAFGSVSRNASPGASGGTPSGGFPSGGTSASFGTPSGGSSAGGNSPAPAPGAGASGGGA